MARMAKIVINGSLYRCPYRAEHVNNVQCYFNKTFMVPLQDCTFVENGYCNYCIPLEDALKELNK